MEICKVCGEEAIIEDEGTDGCMQKVCAECGVVQSAYTAFLDDANPDCQSKSDWLFNHQSISTSLQRMLCTERELEPRKTGLQKITDHGSLLGLSQLLIEESKELFTSSYKEFFMTRLRPFKMLLATSCVYCVCRLHGHAILIRQVCDVAQVSPADFSKVFRELCLRKGLVLPPISAGSAIATVLRKSLWDDSKWMVNRTQDILQLADKHWLVTGRSTEHLLTAAIFLAWLSKDFHGRRKKKLASFCKERNYLFGPATRRRYFEIRKVLVQMSSHIPWLTANNMTVNNVAMEIEDILKYQKSILSEFVKKGSTLEESDNCAGEPTEQDSSPDELELLPPSCKKLRLSKNIVKLSDIDKPISSKHDLDSEELTEYDIKDCDLINYTKTPEEMKSILKISGLNSNN